ncbi:MAG: ABC transporter substrate-binding protein [Cryobacterium sp.]|nr:ABC transporter substrate-binding protein [Cryobacterium sp.]
MKHRLGNAALASAAALVMIGLAGCAAGSATPGDSGSLVLDTSFDVKTLDPGRSFEPTGTLINHVLYQTLLTFAGDDVSKPVAGLATFALTDQDKVLTLTMKDGSEFSDGTPVTVDDAVFSLQRVQGIAGNPSFLLDGVTVAKTSDTTLTLTSSTPNPTLAYLLPNPSLGVVNSAVVKTNGGTTDKNDKAEGFLNATSAGSGPYELESYDATSQIVLKANPKYTEEKPAYSRVVLRNVAGETQKINIQAGESQVAIDLNPDQVSDLPADTLNVKSSPSRYTIYMMLNQDPAVSTVTSNPKFSAAVKLALDYDKLLALAGQGAERPGGVVPSMFVGALPTAKGNQFDLATAKKVLAESGYAGAPVTLHYANDVTVSGIALQPLAETVQSQLKQAGINIVLAPAPEATELDNYRAGKEEMGIWSWGADYPDPQNYIAFAPGENLGKRAGWIPGATPRVDDLRTTAQAASFADRGAAYEDLQVAFNEDGPFIALFQPVSNIVTAKSVTSYNSNAVWTIDIASIK